MPTADLGMPLLLGILIFWGAFTVFAIVTGFWDSFHHHDRY